MNSTWTGFSMNVFLTAEGMKNVHEVCIYTKREPEGVDIFKTCYADLKY